MNLILSYRAYPCSIGRYFRFAFESLGHKVWLAGTFSPTLPYALHMDYSNILDVPDYIIPEDMNVWDASHVISECPFAPDAILSFNAGLYLHAANRQNIKAAEILTDPHALPQFYIESLTEYDYIFSMQGGDYIEPYKNRHGAVWYLPYAASHLHHYWMGTDFSNRPYHLCMISGSLHHPKRLESLNELARTGLNLRLDTGLLYEDATKEYNLSLLSFNRSTELDLPARFFEGLATRNLVLTERLPDLEYFDGLQEDVHYVAYDSLDEMCDKAIYYSTRPDAAWTIATAGYAAYFEQNHTYLRRAQTILDCLGLK